MPKSSKLLTECARNKIIVKSADDILAQNCLARLASSYPEAINFRGRCQCAFH